MSGGPDVPAEGVSAAPIGAWMLKLAVACGVLGALVGAGRGYFLHLPQSELGGTALRFGLAGAAAGAGVPPCVRGAFLAARAALWIAIAIALWVTALALAGQLPWLSRHLR